MTSRLTAWMENKPWIWALAGSLLMWIIIGVLSSKLSLNSLVVNAGIATFLAVISFGQMFAITSGDGGIDLSIPYVVTLTAFISMGVTNGANGRVIYGVLIALAVGLLVGLINATAILVFRIPPIIATLAVGFILNTAVLIYAAKFSAFSRAPFLNTIANGRILGLPWMIVLVVIVALLIGFLLFRTPYGRSLFAVGQKREAAHLAGIKVKRTILIAYMLSGLFAALGGVLIAAKTGGAFLGMGDPYLLESVGAVVIGGTFIAGGKSTVIGTLAGSLFLVLIVTLMGVTHLPIGIQDIIEGVVIILVLSFASGERKPRGAVKKS